MPEKNIDSFLTCSSKLDEAQGFGDIWKIVKDIAKNTLAEQRAGIMLFLADLPLGLGAYHPLGTNNVVLNRTLIQVVEASTKSKRLTNAFVYNLLLHEYLHALGHISEREVRSLVYDISKKCFGKEHVASQLARTGPWSLLRNLPLDRVPIDPQSHELEIVRDFDKTDRPYIS